MSSAPKVSGSKSLHALYGGGLSLKPSKSFSSLPRTSASNRTRTSGKAPDAGANVDETGNNDLLGWLNRPGPVKTALELVGLSDSLTRVISLSGTKGGKPFISSNKNREIESTSVKHLLVFILCSLSCVSISLTSSLFVILRAMFVSRIYTVATRLGLGPSSQQDSTFYKKVASSTTVLQERLEVANLAVKQLKRESLALQAKLIAAGDRISRLGGNQADRAAFDALQVKYTQVSAELTRLTKENDELRTNGFWLTKENAELRQCLAMQEADMGNDANSLGTLARLQNQRLDSCIFPKDDEMPREGDNEEGTNEASEDSIVIVTDLGYPRSMPKSSNGTSAPALVLSASPSMVAEYSSPTQVSISAIGTNKVTYTSAPSSCKSQTPKARTESVNPIPVFTTPRPSLPPRASKLQLKPLLLATLSASSGSARRLGAKHASVRKLGAKAIESSKVGNAKDNEDGHETGVVSRPLNPCAPAFTPRTDGVAPTKAITNDTKSIKSSAAPSPAFSPYIFTSPSPNSPFLRPPPLRRQSGDAPSLAIIPPSPIGTPRSTRATSVRLIRARVALRNSQRVASGSEAVPPGSPVGLKGVRGAHAKARLVGKGIPPRRALRELTNAEPYLEAAAGRWLSL